VKWKLSSMFYISQKFRLQTKYKNRNSRSYEITEIRIILYHNNITSLRNITSKLEALSSVLCLSVAIKFISIVTPVTGFAIGKPRWQGRFIRIRISCAMLSLNRANISAALATVTWWNAWSNPAKRNLFPDHPIKNVWVTTTSLKIGLNCTTNAK